MKGVDDFRVKLDTKELLGLIGGFHRGDRGMGRVGDHMKSRWKLLNRIPMGHPDRKCNCGIKAKK